MDWDGGLTWAAPKNSSAVLTGGSTEMMSWPRTKPTYLYMLVLKSSWARGSGQESAHCCSAHCSALSCRALVRHSGTGWRAPCPLQISTSSKWPMISGLDYVLAQPGSGSRSPQMRMVWALWCKWKENTPHGKEHQQATIRTFCLWLFWFWLLKSLKPKRNKVTEVSQQTCTYWVHAVPCLCLWSALHVHLNWAAISAPLTFSLSPIYTHAQSCTHTVMVWDKHTKACSCSHTYTQTL